jgi:hypothetical protein
MWNVFYLLLNLGEDDFSRFALASHHDLTQLEANKYTKTNIGKKRLFLNFYALAVRDVWVRVMVRIVPPWLVAIYPAKSLTLPVAATSTLELAFCPNQGLTTFMHILFIVINCSKDDLSVWAGVCGQPRVCLPHHHQRCHSPKTNYSSI